MEFLCRHVVGKYINNYKKYGLDSLILGHSTCDPRLLNTEQEKVIVETNTNNTPDEVGFIARKNWTIELVRQWVINTFNITFSHRGMGEVLYRLNLSYTRPTYGKHSGVMLIGVLNYETGCIYCEEHEKYDAEVFLKFLKNVLLQYQAGKIVMVLDNARIHHTKLIQPFLEGNKHRLTLLFLHP